MFKKFASIPNHNNQKVVDYLKENNLTSGEWINREKIHGCNFSIMAYTNGDVKYGSRETILESNFHDHLNNESVKDVTEKMKALSKELNQNLRLICEYYGGSIINVKKITYFNDPSKKALMALKLQREDMTYFNEDEFEELMVRFDIPRPQILFKGTFDECISQNRSFKSGISEVNTIAEGFVSTPVEMRYLDENPVFIKCVSDEFKETVDTKPVKETVNLSEQITPYITEMRLGKIAGKLDIQPSMKAKFGQLMVALVDDIATDSGITDKKQIKELCTPIVKQYFA